MTAASDAEQSEPIVTATAPNEAIPAQQRPIWTGPYRTLGVVIFLNYFNQSAIRPVLPVYVLFLGGTETVAGIALACFSIVSFSIRPALGRLIDRSEGARVLIAGSLILCVFTAALSINVLWVAIAVFTLRGAGWAAVNASGNALLAHLAPPDRRGEASGYYALFQSLAITLGPAIALYWIARTDDYPPVFVIAGALSAVALRLCRGLRNVEHSDRSRSERPAGQPESKWVARSALTPSLLLIFMSLPHAAVLGFFPLYAQSIGLSAASITTFYVLSGIGAILGRAVLGRISDRTSRGAGILTGYGLIGLSLVAILQADVTPVVLAAACLYSLGQGTTLPAVTALAIDRAGEGEIGHAMATFSAAFQVGLGSGGLLAGILIDHVGYVATYQTMIAFVVVAMAVTLRLWSRLATARSS